VVNANKITIGFMIQLIMFSSTSNSEAAFLSPISIVGTGTWNNSVNLLNDGIIPDKGVFWQDSRNVWWVGTGTTFVLDYGAQFVIKDLVVSVDNNDDYQFDISVDGLSYSPLVTLRDTFGTVAPAPGGMDTISSILGSSDYVLGFDFSPAVGRYLKVTGLRGDNLFSLGEVQAFGTPVPEPISLALWGLGIGCCRCFARKRTKSGKASSVK